MCFTSTTIVGFRENFETTTLHNVVDRWPCFNKIITKQGERNGQTGA